MKDTRISLMRLSGFSRKGSGKVTTYLTKKSSSQKFSMRICRSKDVSPALHGVLEQLLPSWSFGAIPPVGIHNRERRTRPLCFYKSVQLCQNFLSLDSNGPLLPDLSHVKSVYAPGEDAISKL